MTVAIARDAEILARCRAEPDRCPDAARRLLDIVAEAQAKSGRALLGDINRFVNLAIRFERDTLRPGGADAWAAPLATLSAGRGDCEDYAILKYLALQQAGVAPGDLRFVVVRDLRRQEDHAVLAARLDGRWLVLDNRTLALVDDDDLAGYAAVTAFGADPDDVRFAEDSRPELARRSPPRQADPS